MTLTRRLTACALIAGLIGLAPPGPAQARKHPVPSWAKEAVNYLADRGLIDRRSFRADHKMDRSAFKELMKAAFGGGFSRTKGKVTAGEVNAALVRALDRRHIADSLRKTKSPDGWSPDPHKRFGTEVVARELGLRFNRPAGEEEALEAADDQKIRQADVAYSVWRALTGPSTYSADALQGFELPNYTRKQRNVISFAMSLAGSPYIWGGEWKTRTPQGYGYGAQESGGFDCSGFIWYVLQAKSASYSPPGRGYKGWSIPERSSSSMAAATPKKQRLRYKELEPGDVLLFASDGRRSKASDVYHAGLYLGEGWMIHSSGSRAGVSISSVAPGNWWHDQLIWGRRVID